MTLTKNPYITGERVWIGLNAICLGAGSFLHSRISLAGFALYVVPSDNYQYRVSWLFGILGMFALVLVGHWLFFKFWANVPFTPAVVAMLVLTFYLAFIYFAGAYFAAFLFLFAQKMEAVATIAGFLIIPILFLIPVGINISLQRIIFRKQLVFPAKWLRVNLLGTYLAGLLILLGQLLGIFEPYKALIVGATSGLVYGLLTAREAVKLGQEPP